MYSYADETSIEEFENFNENPILRALKRSKEPVWLNMLSKNTPLTQKASVCNEHCVANGLEWAETLGTTAQEDFKVIFKPISDYDITNPSLSYYVTLLHKRTMGTKVFDTKMINGDKKNIKFFTHCSQNISGAFTVMGINFADSKTKILTKLPSKYTGADVMQYILTVDKSSNVQINAEPVNVGASVVPIIKMKRPNRPTSFSLPAKSIGFWIFPSANLMECLALTESTEENAISDTASHFEKSKTTSDLLLQELIRESVGATREQRTKRHAIIKKDARPVNPRDRRQKRAITAEVQSKNMLDQMLDEKEKREARILKNQFLLPFKLAQKALYLPKEMMANRSKRQMNNHLGKLLEKFDLTKHRKLNIPPIFKLGPLGIPPILSKTHDVYNNKEQSTKHLFKSAENTDLPTGDVYMEVGADHQSEDYVAFDENDRKPLAPPATVEPQKIPDQYLEMYEIDQGNNNYPSEIRSDDELWETDRYHHKPSENMLLTDGNLSRVMESSSKIQKVIKGVEPTWQEDHQNLRKAKESLHGMYVQNRHTEPIYYPQKSDDDFFLTRRRRAINSNFNDEIEKKVSEIDVRRLQDISAAYESAESAKYLDSKSTKKLELLNRISKLVTNIEKSDNEDNVARVNDEISEIENILMDKSDKFKLFKSKFSNARKQYDDSIPRKCKVLALSLEQKCLRDISRRKITKREIKSTKEKKIKKNINLSKKIKAVVKDEKKIRSRRNAIWDGKNNDVFVEDDIANNIIQKNVIIMDEDTNVNNVVPSVSFIKTIYLPNDQENPSSDTVNIIQSGADIETYSPNVVYRNSIDVGGDDAIDNIGEDINTDIDTVAYDNKYNSPKFMKTFTKSVSGLMDMVNRHVSGWWHAIS